MEDNVTTYVVYFLKNHISIVKIIEI
jgi:hypothetical protein